MDTIAPEDKPDGFVTTLFNKEQLAELIEKEDGITGGGRRQNHAATPWRGLGILVGLAFVSVWLRTAEYRVWGEVMTVENSIVWTYLYWETLSGKALWRDYSIFLGVHGG